MSAYYFNHQYISNSDLRAFRVKMGLAREMPENMQAIYDFGELFHKSILEPNRITEEEREHPDFELAQTMAKQFWKDPICRQFAMASDFEREKEFYNADVAVGPYLFSGRAKMDGARTKIRYMLELKGLGVSTQKQFEEGLVALDYDQAVAHYQATSGYELSLMVGISKRREALFRRIVKRYDDWYLNGEQKLIDNLTLLREWSPEDVRMAS